MQSSTRLGQGSAHCRWRQTEFLPQPSLLPSDTTRLQPVVLQLCNYTATFSTTFGHHQASAGGTSTSSLNTTPTTEIGPVLVAVKLKHHRLKPGGVRVFACPVASCEIDGPPAKARWCPNVGCSVGSCEV